jgi:hypothetical protein
MNLRVTLGFVAAAVVLTLLVVGLDRFNVGPTSTNNANATATTTASQTPPIFQFDDSRVVAFELRIGDQTVRVERQGDTWKLADTGEAANRSSFAALMVRMSQLKATRAVPNPGTDLAQYGLAPARESAVAILDDGTRYELQLGVKTPVQTGTYARVGDSPDVYVIADQFATDLERLVGDPREPATPTPRAASPVPVTPTPVP